MASFYEIKEMICRGFGKKLDTQNDEDVLIDLHGYGNGEADTFYLLNDELKDIYDRVVSGERDGLELCIDNNIYESIIELDYDKVRRNNFWVESEDSERNIIYKIDICSIEYCIYLLNEFIDYHKNDGDRKILPRKFRVGASYVIRYENIKELDWKKILPLIIKEYSIKIMSNNNSLCKSKKLRTAYIFEYIYKTGTSISEYPNIDSVLKPMRLRIRKEDSDVDVIPHREYVADVVDYYRIACSSKDEYIKYISFYHIMEYFYDEIFKRKLVSDLTDKLTHPDFSYKNENKVYELATFVKKRMNMNDQTGQGNELESLKFVIQEYVNISDLKNKLENDNAGITDYYQHNKVGFAGAPIIPWTDSEGVFTSISKRIYFTRNALIHSKSGKNRERYRPYRDEGALNKEIPLVKAIAEFIIINSSEIA
ncbi:hypothetical protein [Butyrivibrio sp. FC2001]|uniref:hypothetical protein n=1 Tax=Butyrivibrio sp. FC2001 TaxID=1280671 RepID=UPI0004186AB6|nr:hypothetical protein [Butyrivibrio sp. FC2001]